MAAHNLCNAGVVAVEAYGLVLGGEEPRQWQANVAKADDAELVARSARLLAGLRA